MINYSDTNVFCKILSPVMQIISNTVNTLGDDDKKYKLSFLPFTVNLLYGIMSNIKSRAQLITETKTSDIAEALKLVVASNSMYNEAFHRYKPELYREIFLHLLSSLSFMSIPGIDQLGHILLVDGSIFPAISTMGWATYKSTANALKLHLAFELNRMIPVEFLSTEANYSEKRFLLDIVKEGITYILDRGYVSFNGFKAILDKKAFFIVRCKGNLQYQVRQYFEVNLPAKASGLLEGVRDMKIVLENDKNRDDKGKRIEYRLIVFSALGESYVLITNRFDLSTYEVIMLYAYRWQVELVFRFLKRTLNSIHLLCHDPEGVQVQFYLYMISYLLLLSFKQECEAVAEDETQEDEASELAEECAANPKEERHYVCGLVSMLGQGLKKYWKISVHWLITVRNFFLKSFTVDIAKRIVLCVE